MPLLCAPIYCSFCAAASYLGDAESKEELINMVPVEKIVKALAAGAASRLRPNVVGLENTIVIDQYQALKELIGHKYAQVDEDILDIGPASTERQQQMMDQLQAASAGENEEILQQVEVLLSAIMEHDPEAIWASTPTNSLSDHT